MRRPPEPVPASRLEDDTLRRVIRELVLREDANDDPGGLAARIEAACAAARSGRLKLWFHPDDGSITWTDATSEGEALKSTLQAGAKLSEGEGRDPGAPDAEEY